MKVYFTASLTGKEKYQINYEQIVATLKELGHTVVADHIFNVTPSKVCHESPEVRFQYFKYLNKWLSKCGLFVAETSFPSTSVGFEISVALSRNIPALVLYASKVGLPPVIVGLQGDKLWIEEYNVENLKKILVRSLAEIKSVKSTRFTMLLSPQLTECLDKVAKGGRSRSEYIRNLILQDIKRKQ